MTPPGNSCILDYSKRVFEAKPPLTQEEEKYPFGAVANYLSPWSMAIAQLFACGAQARRQCFRQAVKDRERYFGMLHPQPRNISGA